MVPHELAGRLMVVFEDIDMKPEDIWTGEGEKRGALSVSSRIAELERELQVTRESHHTTIEELESSNEELKSTNEEMQSSNEELQSTNEELESSKEELQSLNEELQTVNSELQSKVEELSAAHDDMRNLMNSTEIATIFVDNDMHIRRFTAEATRIINLIQTDIGRPIQHVVTNLKYDEMISDLAEVIKDLTPKECEVQTAEGKWFNMRIIPYRTTDNRIDGAVLTFSSIDDQKKAQKMLEVTIQESECARELVKNIFDINPDPMAVLDKDGKIVIANASFVKLIQIKNEDLPNVDLIKKPFGIINQLKLNIKLKAAMKQNQGFIVRSFEMDTSEGMKEYSLDAYIIKKDYNFPYRILLHFYERR